MCTVQPACFNRFPWFFPYFYLVFGVTLSFSSYLVHQGMVPPLQCRLVAFSQHFRGLWNIVDVQNQRWISLRADMMRLFRYWPVMACRTGRCLQLYVQSLAPQLSLFNGDATYSRQKVIFYEVVTCMALLLIFVASSISQAPAISGGPSNSWKVLDKLADMDFTDDEVDTSLFWSRQQFSVLIQWWWSVNSEMLVNKWHSQIQAQRWTIWMNLGGPWFNLWAFWSAFPGKGALTKLLEVWCQVSPEFYWLCVGNRRLRNRLRAWFHRRQWDMWHKWHRSGRRQNTWARTPCAHFVVGCFFGQLGRNLKWSALNCPPSLVHYEFICTDVRSCLLGNGISFQ